MKSILQLILISPLILVTSYIGASNLVYFTRTTNVDDCMIQYVKSNEGKGVLYQRGNIYHIEKLSTSSSYFETFLGYKQIGTISGCNISLDKSSLSFEIYNEIYCQTTKVYNYFNITN